MKKSSDQIINMMEHNEELQKEVLSKMSHMIINTTPKQTDIDDKSWMSTKQHNYDNISWVSSITSQDSTKSPPVKSPGRLP